MIDNISDSISSNADKTKKVITNTYNLASDKLSGVIIPFLSNPELLDWSENITKGVANVYDRALDQEYLKTHIGGGNHRMFDGGHDLYNAWDKVKDAKSDDSTIEEIVSYVASIWKDVTTTQGLPVFSWDKDNYDKYAEMFSGAIPGIDKAYFYDLMSFDVFEVIGASIGVAAIIFSLKKNDQKKIAEVIGAMGITSVASANPIMAISLVFIIAYVVFVKKKEINKESLAKGAIISTISLTLFSILGFPLLIELGIAIIITMVVKKQLFENKELIAILKNRLLDIEKISKKQLNISVNKIEFILAEVNESIIISQLNKAKVESWNFISKTLPSLPNQTQNLFFKASG